MKNLVAKPAVLLFFSAVLSALPLTFENAFLLSWISFIPLFYVIITKSGDKLRYAIGRGFLFGLIYHICIYYWFLWFYPLDFINLTSGSSAAVVCLAWFGISAVHGALWCIPTLFCHIAQRLNKNPLFLSFVGIIGMVSAQKLTQISELSFPWTRISLGQYKATALIQSASLFGIDGTDVLILSINALIAVCIIAPPKKRVLAAVSAAIIFIANLGFGLIKINNTSKGEELTVMTVQGSVEQADKWASNGASVCYEIYSELTKQNLTDAVDLIIWPESAVPKVYKTEKSLKQYKKLSKELDTPLLAGILCEKNEIHTNNTLLIDSDGVISAYSKRQLVPFGEYMPYESLLSDLFPYLDSLNIIEDDYTAGTDTAIMEINGRKIGNIICFESIYPELSRQSVLDGAELMIEVTNDSWLKDSVAMYQHLAHGVFRSIENGRCLVRSANSGVSAIIDSRGKVKTTLDVNEQGVITDTVYFSNEITLYTKTGDVLFPICVVLLLILILVFFAKKFIDKKPAKC